MSFSSYDFKSADIIYLLKKQTVIFKIWHYSKPNDLAKMNPLNLRIEFLIFPVPIDVKKPTFTVRITVVRSF